PSGESFFDPIMFWREGLNTLLKRMITRFKDKCGAVTVEALVSFVGFLFVIITILNVANYCRAQMVISNAVDAAAREMAQYSYFYEMSGMKKFNDYVNDNAGVGAANLNDVIDGTSSVYTTLSKALSDTSDSGNLLADKIDNQTLNFQDIQSAVLNLDTNATNILSSINTLETTFNSVERNPLLYAKSLAAVATEQGLDITKSYVIAAPLAKLFTQTNINSGELSVQQYLENLGIVGGLDGLNFNTSTMFSSGEQDDIHIRCYYRISLCNFVDRSLFDVPICKEAVCGAWLGGDDNHVKVSQKAAVPPMPDRSMPEMVDVSGDDAGEGSGDVSDGEGVLVAEEPEKDSEETDEEFLSLISTIRDENLSKEERQAALAQIAEIYNKNGGADFDEALEVYRLALETHLNFDEAALKDKTGKGWKVLKVQNKLSKEIDGDYVKFIKYVHYFDNSEMSEGEKYSVLKDIYEGMEHKNDIMFPSEWYYIKDINSDGSISIDWGDNLGFYQTKDERFISYNSVAISRDNPDSLLPKNWDRYGRVAGGYNFSDIPEGDKYTMSERALPYLANEDAYHKGSMNDDLYFDLIDAIRDPDSSKESVSAVLGTTIDSKDYEKLKEDYNKYLKDLKEAGIKIDAPYGLMGYAAPAFDCGGGAKQYTTPISIDLMIKLGMASEDPKVEGE
ncbi:hypothetical protein SAMN02910339_00001, partial [Lachnospiraceae bacterium YSD2013]